MKQELSKYITAAQSAIYSPERAKVFIPMLDTRQGSISAVGSVLSAIEKMRPIPPQIYQMLAVHIYLLMVDVAMGATGDKPNKDVMKKTIASLLSTIGGANGSAN